MIKSGQLDGRCKVGIFQPGEPVLALYLGRLARTPRLRRWVSVSCSTGGGGAAQAAMGAVAALRLDRALVRRFQKIDVAEPTVADTIKILNGLKSRYEAHHKVRFTGAALKTAVDLSARYINDRKLPRNDMTDTKIL